MWPAISVVSELTTNAVLHARTEFAVELVLAGGKLEVRVADSSPHLPVRRRYDDDAATGRGLALLEALTSDWGVTATDDGKVVWCVVEASEEWRSGASHEPSVEDAPAPSGDSADLDGFGDGAACLAYAA
jgi:hypothetical protein